MKQTIEDYRKEYENVTGEKPSIRWSKKKIQKEIALWKAEQEFDKSQSPATIPTLENNVPKPEFEKLVSDNTKSFPPCSAGDTETGNEPDGRGGYRENAGRPTGQTDRRAQAERMLNLEVPDLGVALAVDALNAGLAKSTGVGIDDKSITGEAMKDMPSGSKSLALGITKILYFWFPSLQNRTDLVTLHLQALFLMLNPFRERAITMALIKKAKEQEEKAKQPVQQPVQPVQTPYNPDLPETKSESNSVAQSIQQAV